MRFTRLFVYIAALLVSSLAIAPTTPNRPPPSVAKPKSLSAAPPSFIWNIPAGARGSIWQSDGGLVKWDAEVLGNPQPGGQLTWKRFTSGPTQITFIVDTTVPQRYFLFIPESQFCCVDPEFDVPEPLEWTWNDYYD